MGVFAEERPAAAEGKQDGTAERLRQLAEHARMVANHPQTSTFLAAALLEGAAELLEVAAKYDQGTEASDAA